MLRRHLAAVIAMAGIAASPIACVPAQSQEARSAREQPSVASVEPHEPDVEPAQQPRFALIWGNAFVFVDATEGAAKARMRSYADNARADHLGDVWPVEVLAEQGTRWKVRTLGGADASHCHRGPSFLNAFSVILYVAPGDLAAVTTAPAASRFDDGSWAAVNAGVVVAADRLLAAADGLRLPLPEGTKIGRTYAHHPRFDTRAVVEQTRDPLTVGGVAIAEDALTSVPVRRVDGGRISVVTGCLQAEAPSSDALELVPHVSPDATDSASPAAPKSAKHFAIGTPLYYRDGRVAGSLVDAIAMSLLDRHGERLCFQRSLAEHAAGEVMPEHHRLELCLDAHAAREKPQKRARWSVPTRPPREAPP